MRKFYRNPYAAFALTLSLLLWIQPAFAASNVLEVVCVDENGKPATSVKVQIQQLGNAKEKDKKSNNKGIALFDKLDDGVYRVWARRDGSGPALYEFVLLTDDSRQSVTLRFEPGDSMKKLYFEDQVLTRRAFDLLNQGVAAIQENNLQEAIKQIEASIEIDPSNPEALLSLGIAYIQERVWDKAEAVLKRGSNLSAVLMTLPQVNTPGGTNPYEGLMQRFEMVLSKIPVLKLRGEGDVALSERRFSDAIAKYDEALKSEPDNPDLLYNLALAHANAKNYDEAGGFIDHALQLRPGERAFTDLRTQITDLKEGEVLSRAQAILDEGKSLVKNSDYAGALKKFEEVLAMVPQDKKAIVLQEIGSVQDLLQRPDQAIEAYRRATELAPENNDYRRALAQYYLKVKKYDEALNLYAQPGMSGQPADQTLFDLGRSQSKQGNSEVAQLAFERAIQANPDHAEAYYELGMILYYSKKNDKRAQETLTKYMQIGKDKGHLDNTESVLVVLKKRM